MIGKIKDTLTPASRQVYYGPNRGTPEWRSRGAFGWGCGPCAVRGQDVGGFVDCEDEARRAAEEHAKTHRGARAVYGDG